MPRIRDILGGAVACALFFALAWAVPLTCYAFTGDAVACSLEPLN